MAADDTYTSENTETYAPAQEPAPSTPVEAVSAGPALADVEAMIKDHVIAAMACGLVPVPAFDMVSVVAVQLRLANKLSKAYGVPFADNMAKNAILALVGGVMPTMATASLASLLKFIPGLGSFVGGAGVSLLSGALTYAVGRVLSQHFESGGTLLDFDPTRVRDRFRSELKAGQEAARGMQSGSDSAAA